MSIEVERVSKQYGIHPALSSVSISIGDGELLALLGPSGGGKTTLLRIIAGLEAPDAGEVKIRGKDVSRAGVRDRGVGFVFQHYALFREMTVLENIAFGLRVKPKKLRPSEAAIQKKCSELLALVQLTHVGSRYPEQLSGGQRQRVALARALAIEPAILLLDEPFGALDAKVRRELRQWLRRLHDEIKVTTVFVTHDQEEAFELADRVAIVHQGRIEQTGSPQEIWRAPASEFVREFVSGRVVVSGRITGERQVELDSSHLPLPAAPKGTQLEMIVSAVRVQDGVAHEERAK